MCQLDSKGLNLEEEIDSVPNADEPVKIWNKLSTWILFFLALLLPLIVNPFGTDPAVLPKLVFLRLVTLALVVLWILDSIFKWELSFRKTFLDKSILAVASIVLISTLLSVHLPTSLYGEYTGVSYEGLLIIFNYILLFWLVVNIFDSEKRVNLIAAGLLAGMFLVSVYGILQHFGLTLFKLSLSQTDPTRVNATFNNAVFLGSYLSLLTPLSFSLLLDSDYRKLRFWLLILVTLASLICLFFTRTFSAFLGVGFAAIFVIAFNFGAIRKSRASQVLIIFFITIFLLAIFVQAGTLKDKLTSFSGVASRTDEGSRTLMWKATLPMIKDYPLLGVGPDCYGLVYPKYRPANWIKLDPTRYFINKPENEILYTASTLGLLGLASFIWLFITLFWNCWNALKKGFKKETAVGSRVLLIGLLGGILAYLIQLQFSCTEPSATPFLWILIGLALVNTDLGLERENKMQISLKLPKKWEPNLVIKQLIAVVAGLLLVSISSRIIYPLLANIHLKNALDYEATSSWKSAFKEYDKALTYIQDEDYFVYPGQTYLKLAQDTRRFSYANSAISKFEEAIKINPSEGYLYYQLGKAYLVGGCIRNSQGYLEQAAKELGQALELDPYYPPTLVELGKALFYQGKVEQATKWWEEAIKIDSRIVEAYLYLGWAYRQQGMKLKAIKAYRKALELEPGNSVAQKALDELMRKTY